MTNLSRVAGNQRASLFYLPRIYDELHELLSSIQAKAFRSNVQSSRFYEAPISLFLIHQRSWNSITPLQYRWDEFE